MAYHSSFKISKYFIFLEMFSVYVFSDRILLKVQILRTLLFLKRMIIEKPFTYYFYIFFSTNVLFNDSKLLGLYLADTTPFKMLVKLYFLWLLLGNNVDY